MMQLRQYQVSFSDAIIIFSRRVHGAYSVAKASI